MSLKQVFNKYRSDFAICHDVASDGSVLIRGTVGSGFPLGDSTKTFRFAANSSGQKPAGIVTQRIRAVDETNDVKNFWNNEAPTGWTVEVITHGEVYLDNIYPGESPTDGDIAYMGPSGYLTKTLVGTVQTPAVGKFLGKKDEAGFVKVYVDLP